MCVVTSCVCYSTSYVNMLDRLGAVVKVENNDYTLCIWLEGVVMSTGKIRKNETDKN